MLWGFLMLIYFVKVIEKKAFIKSLTIGLTVKFDVDFH